MIYGKSLYCYELLFTVIVETWTPMKRFWLFIMACRHWLHKGAFWFVRCHFETDEIVVQQVMSQSGQTATFVKPKWRDLGQNIFCSKVKRRCLVMSWGVEKLEHVCGEEAVLM